MWRHTEIRTIPDIVRHWARRTPEKVALRAGSAVLSYAALDISSNKVAQALGGAIEPGSNVCFVGKNVPEFWEAWLGACKAGSPFVPLNWRCSVHELVELVDDSGAEIALVDGEFADTMERVRERCQRELKLVLFDSLADGGEGLAAWSADCAGTDPAVPLSGDDIALIGYTSGTTGRPKGAMIRHEAFDLSFLSDELEPTITSSDEDTMLMVMPNFHLAGSWVSLPALYHGGTVAMIKSFEPSAVIAAVAEFRPTVMCLVPAAIQGLLDFPGTASADWSSLRTLIYAGSPIGATTIRRALQTLGCELRQFYGTTETYIITILRPDEHDPAKPEQLASCGSPVPLVDVRLVDAIGKEVPQGEVGQVLVHSPMVMEGYLGQPQATAEAIRDGWYWTGDVGYVDAAGRLFLVDRAKDMVVSGGENIYSVEVERALQVHPDVAMVAVVGTPDERWGEAVTAFVVPVPGASLDGEALRAHCRELIAGYKVPKIVHVRETLPMTPMGKIRKVDLRKEVRQ